MSTYRNAGRKPVLNPIRVQVTIPKEKLTELKEFVKKIQYE